MQLVRFVPIPDVFGNALLAPATHATSPMPPAAPVAMATAAARMDVNSDPGLLDETFRLRDTGVGNRQGHGLGRVGQDRQSGGAYESTTKNNR